jgi:hypothetical protein
MPTRQRNSDQVSLQVATPADDASSTARSPFGDLVPPWVMGGVTGSLGVILGGWLLVAIWSLVGWWTEITGGIGGVLAFAARAWLGSNGTGLRLGSTLMTVIPLGLTAVSVAGLAATGYFAARSGRAFEDDKEATPPARVVWQTAAAATAAYAGVVLVLALIFTTPVQAVRGVALSLVLALLASGAGACAGVRWSAFSRLPGWVRWGARSVGAGLAVLAALGAAAFVVALVAHWERVMALSAGLNLSAAPATILFLGQAAFWPNFVLWAASWALGGGLTIGTGTSVTVVSTHLGLLPAFPVFGAVPQSGIAEPGQVLWLAGGILAGAVAGIVAVRAWSAGGGHGRAEIAGGVGLLAGLATAACWIVLAALSRGDLGAERLVGVGPRLLEGMAFAAGLLGVSGAVCGAAYALWLARKGGPETSGVEGGPERRGSTEAPEAPGADPDATAPLPEPHEETRPLRRTRDSSGDETRPIERPEDPAP